MAERKVVSGRRSCGFWLIIGLTVVAVNCLSLPVLAQGEYTVRLAQVQTSGYPEITLYVEVSDAAGKPVTDLQQADFTITEDGQPVEIVDFAGVGDERPADVVFVFDTTGSMGDEIEGVKDTCIAFAEELESKGRDYRLGLVTFWDEIKGVYHTDGTLTDDVRQFKRWIEGLRAQGGDDGPELALDAMIRGSQMHFRDEAQRVLILITDASPHHRDDPTGFSDLTIDQTLHSLEAAHVTLFAAAPDLSELPERDSVWRGLPGRYGLPATNEYKRMTDGLGGKYYNIAREPDFTGIIEQIGTSLATQYRITYRSPRPAYDGTRRDIRASVGAGTVVGSTGGGTYLEKHLLNIQSAPMVGVICLLPLLVMLIAPVGLRRVSGLRKPQPSPPPSPAPFTCSHCSHPLRQGAKFCPGCGRSTMVSPPPQLVVPTCPRCGYTMRAGARFCAQCGFRRE